MMFVTDTSSMGHMGKVVIVSTALFCSLGSTIFLKAMSSPYVTTMKRLSPRDGDESSNTDNIEIAAKRLTIWGSEKEYIFKVKDVQSVRVSQHPFASFQANGVYFFVFTKTIDDLVIREALEISDRAKQPPK